MNNCHAIACVLLALLSGCTGQSPYTVVVSVQKEQVEGPPGITTRYYINGEHVGCGEDAVQLLMDRPMSEADRVKVVLAPNDKPFDFWSISGRLVAQWVVSGAEVDFYSGADKIQIDHIIVLKDVRHYTGENTAYYFNGCFMGRGDAGIRNLGSARVADGSAILIVSDYRMGGGEGIAVPRADDPWRILLRRWKHKNGCTVYRKHDMWF